MHKGSLVAPDLHGEVFRDEVPNGGPEPRGQLQRPAGQLRHERRQRQAVAEHEVGAPAAVQRVSRPQLRHDLPCMCEHEQNQRGRVLVSIIAGPESMLCWAGVPLKDLNGDGEHSTQAKSPTAQDRIRGARRVSSRDHIAQHEDAAERPHGR